MLCIVLAVTASSNINYSSVKYKKLMISETVPDSITEYLPEKGSKEELYQDIFITLLVPYISKEIDNFYSKYLKELPGVDPTYVYVQRIERPNGDRTAEFLIELLVKPYIGPHIVVGTDSITVRVKYGSIPIIEEFKHIESKKLPPHYQVIIKQWPPS